MLGFPTHCHENSIIPAGVVEEENFFPLARGKLAIFREFERRGRKAIGLSRRVESEDIRFHFIGANDRVANRGRDGHKNCQAREQERQAGEVVDSAQSPRGAETAARPAVKPVGEPEAGADQEGEIDDHLVNMVQDIVA